MMRLCWITRAWSFFSLLAVLFLVSGCTMFAPEPRSIDPSLVPPEFELYETGEKSLDEWWKQFNSNELEDIVDKSLEGNLSLIEAAARLRQAEANARKSNATLYPDSSINGGYSRSRQAIDTDSSMDGTSSSDRYTFGTTISYELDVWGRVQSNRQAVYRDFASSVEDTRAMYLTIVAQVTTSWLDLVLQKEILSVLNSQLITNKQSLDLMETRFRLGQSTTLDVYQQRQSVAAIEALIPATEARISELNNELAILLGLPSGSDLQLTTVTLPQIPTANNPGLPADILAMRPDVRKAGLALSAADWRVAAARADRLPALKLTASHTYGADQIDSLFSNWLSTLAGNLVGPIFDGGRRKAEVDRTRAVVDERLASYRSTVMNAIMEVQNSLITLEANQATLAAQTRQLEAARASWQESLDRYRKGSGNYLPVLTALTQSQQLERSVVQSHYKLLIAHINLCRSIGGSWMDQLVNP